MSKRANTDNSVLPPTKRAKVEVSFTDLIAAIKQHTPFPLGSTITLPRLSLGAFSYGMQPIGPVGTQLLCELLKSNSTVQVLDLHGNKIGPEGASALSDSLKSNSTLTTLNLGNNSIGSWWCSIIEWFTQIKLNSHNTQSWWQLDWICMVLNHWVIHSNQTQLSQHSILVATRLDQMVLNHWVIHSNQTQLSQHSILVATRLEHDGAQSLSDSLKSNSTLTTLNLENTYTASISKQLEINKVVNFWPRGHSGLKNQKLKEYIILTLMCIRFSHWVRAIMEDFPQDLITLIVQFMGIAIKINSRKTPPIWKLK